LGSKKDELNDLQKVIDIKQKITNKQKNHIEQLVNENQDNVSRANKYQKRLRYESEQKDSRIMDLENEVKRLKTMLQKKT